jgi:hypothetical protein
MKTREEFIRLVDAYRTETRRRGMLALPAMIGAILGWIVIAGVMGRLLGNHSVLIGIWIILFFLVILFLNHYQIKSQDSLARKFELICPACSRTLGFRDFKLAIATHNCPHCGALIYS